MTKKPSSLTESVLTSKKEQLSGSSQKNQNKLNYSINDFDDIECPFKLVKHEELGCAILLGSRRMTAWISETECYRLVRERDWKLITELICNIVDKFELIKPKN